jgi:hypothetical protein
MQKTPFSRIALHIGLLLLMHTSSNGGSADTDDTALTVNPNRPAVPSVVTTLTPFTAAPMAFMNSPLSVAGGGILLITFAGANILPPG